MSITFKVKGLDAVVKAANDIAANAKRDVQDELNAFAIRVQKQAQLLAPADNGILRNSIVTEFGDLNVSVFSTLNYAAYQEFGTSKFAAAYVSSLPADWSSYAATFKGKTGGNADDLLQAIMEWVKRKGIVPRATKTAKTGRVTNDKKQQATDDDAAAYAITLSILRNGIKPHPFLYPAYQEQVKVLEANLKKIFS